MKIFISALLAVLLISTVALGAEEEKSCSQRIEIADRVMTLDIPSLEVIGLTVSSCESELLPYFNTAINTLYKKMKAVCQNSWSEKDVPMPSENRMSLMLCQLNCVRFLDSLNVGN